MSRITLAARALNAALTPFSGDRKRPEAAWEKAVDQVQASTGWSVAGDEPFAEDFAFTLRCLADTPGLTPLGWQSGLADLKSRLENRLRIAHLFKTRPEIAEEQIASPVFVVGLPRTATTLAHKVLAASDDHRGPLLWEMAHTDLELDEAAREQVLKPLRAGTNTIRRFFPSWEVIHPIRPDQPEESMFVLPHGTFRLILWAPMPEYRSWLADRDRTGDYEYLKQALQVLQHGREPKRWILKYPAHVGDLDVIQKVFPDATVVWTHRDPTTAIGSLCSLMETAWSMYQRRPDLHAIGELALDLLVDSVARGRDARTSMPSASIVDVPYHRLNSDPHTEVPKLYEAIGARWTPQDEARLDDVLRRPSADRRHEYGLSRYGLDVGRVEEAFGDYMRLVDHFNML